MALKKRLNRCGCDSRLDLPSVAEGPWTCCEDCVEAPCTYAILSPCRYWMPDGELILEPCLLLRKDCIRGCKYSSRWDGGGRDDVPVLRPETCRVEACQPTGGGGGCTSCPDVECFDLVLSSIGDGFGERGCGNSYATQLPLTVRLTGGNCYYFGCVSTPCPDGSTVTFLNQHVLCFYLTIESDTFARLRVLEYISNSSTQSYTYLFEINNFACTGAALSLTTPGDGISNSSLPAGALTGTLTPVSCGSGGGGNPRLDVTLASGTKCTWSADDDDLFVKWVLAPSIQAPQLLQLQTRGGFTAIYAADPEGSDCKDPRTFTVLERSPELHFLPKHLCVQPVESEPEHVCATAADQCACNDPGYDYGQFYMEVTGCDGDLAFVGTVTSDRYFSASTWPCGITFPSPAPCGAFLYTIPLGDCGNDVKMVIWCDGTEYKGKAYCYDDDTACWVEQGDVEIIPPTELLCNGVHLVIRLPEMDCCCQEFIEACGCSTVPSTITADDGTNQIQMTYDSVNNYWQGSGVFFGCGDVGFTLQCLPGNIWYFIDQGALTPGYSPTGSCNPFALSFTGNGCDGVSRTVTFT